ncbi:MAG TPA: ribosome silencing factor [Bacteroidetes bacterium]|nr:ribosome silencing factor [Bacteroidota bacterium]
MTSKNLAKVLANAALSKKAFDITILDLRKLTTMTDYFVVCSVDSDTQARAVADEIKNESLEKGESSVRKEGYSEGRWILMDYMDVVVHVFHKEMREFYNLEKLWGDAKKEYVNDEPAPKEKTIRTHAKTDSSKEPKKKTTRKKTSK